MVEDALPPVAVDVDGVPSFVRGKSHMQWLVDVSHEV